MKEKEKKKLPGLSHNAFNADIDHRLCDRLHPVRSRINYFGSLHERSPPATSKKSPIALPPAPTSVAAPGSSLAAAFRSPRQQGF